MKIDHAKLYQEIFDLLVDAEMELQNKNYYAVQSRCRLAADIALKAAKEELEKP